ncbi:GNAT family N-acetyltransferase [Qipengyuania proteolytica]|uniref:GNAT family N-acetyltransferase n=1 Tax=Qipengyuania proteolytica TaxID=2867239 RepID=UPI001FFC8477|nr:GNAT family N-acetyltransferase [Qipengyuania proteolytica]
MRQNSPEGSVYALDLAGLEQPEISFWAAWDEGDLLGIAALKVLPGAEGEIKSMRTSPEHLRKGVARALLKHIIEVAKEQGIWRLSLETGSGASFEPALALYRSFGFSNGAPFGGYRASDFNQFLHLDMSDGPTSLDQNKGLSTESPHSAQIVDDRLTGRCLCGAVRYEVADAFEYSLNCHCSDCRRATGAAFKSLAGIASYKLRVRSGEESIFRYGDKAAQDLHCRNCGSLIYSLVHDGRIAHVAMGTLDQAPSIRPSKHIFVASKAPWHEITDDLPQFDEFD